jgi:hypothetical protein
MSDKVLYGDRKPTLIKKINDIIDELAAFTTGAVTFTDDVTVEGDLCIDSPDDALFKVDGHDTATILIAGDTRNGAENDDPDSRIIFSTDGNTSTSPVWGYEFAMLNSAGGGASEFLFTEYDSSTAYNVMKFENQGKVRFYDSVELEDGDFKQTNTGNNNSFIIDKTGGGGHIINIRKSGTNKLHLTNAGITKIEDLEVVTSLKLVEGTPASASASTAKGKMLYDSNYIYIATALNTWKRVAISTWV